MKKQPRRPHSRWVRGNARYPLAQKDQILCPCGAHNADGRQREQLLAQVPQDKNWRDRYREGAGWFRGAWVNSATRIHLQEAA